MQYLPLFLILLQFLQIPSAQPLTGPSISFGNQFTLQNGSTSLVLSFLTSSPFNDTIELIQLFDQKTQKKTQLSSTSQGVLCAKEPLKDTGLFQSHFQLNSSFLPMNQTYYYRVQSEPGIIHSFTLAKPDSQKTQLIFYGNFDPSSFLGNQTKIRLQILMTQSYRMNIFQAVFHVGGFPGDFPWSLENLNGIEAYLRSLGTISGNIPYMVTGGVNETGALADSGVFESFFKMPVTNYSNNSYSIDYDQIHLVGLDFSKYIGNSSSTTEVLADFLFYDLSNISNTSWVVVYHSLPFYCSSLSYTDNSTLGIIQNFTKIYEKLNVDLVISAGDCIHYERSYAISEGTIDKSNVSVVNGSDLYQKAKGSTVYVIEGAAGSNTSIQIKWNQSKNQFVRKIGDPLAGFGILSLEPNGVLGYRHISSADGRILDTFMINKTSP